MCRVRTIKDVVAYFKETDPETEVSEYIIRKMITEGMIPAVRVGSKFYVNLDLVIELFSGSVSPAGAAKIHAAAPLVIEK